MEANQKIKIVPPPEGVNKVCVSYMLFSFRYFNKE